MHRISSSTVYGYIATDCGHRVCMDLLVEKVRLYHRVCGRVDAAPAAASPSLQRTRSLIHNIISPQKFLLVAYKSDQTSAKFTQRGAGRHSPSWIRHWTPHEKSRATSTTVPTDTMGTNHARQHNDNPVANPEQNFGGFESKIWERAIYKVS